MMAISTTVLSIEVSRILALFKNAYVLGGLALAAGILLGYFGGRFGAERSFAPQKRRQRESFQNP